eukprot:1157493-Pelagomonas_calceolata.AAC.4
MPPCPLWVQGLKAWQTIEFKSGWWLLLMLVLLAHTSCSCWCLLPIPLAHARASCPFRHLYFMPLTRLSVPLTHVGEGVAQDAALAMMMENLSSMASRNPTPMHFDAAHEYVYQVWERPREWKEHDD